MRKMRKFVAEAKAVLLLALVIGVIGFMISFFVVSSIPMVCIAAFAVSFIAAAVIGVIAGMCDEYRVSIRIERKR